TTTSRSTSPSPPPRGARAGRCACSRRAATTRTSRPRRRGSRPWPRGSRASAVAYALADLRDRVEGGQDGAVGGRVAPREHPDLAGEGRAVVVDDVLGHPALGVEAHDVAAGEVERGPGRLDAEPRRAGERPACPPADRGAAFV